MKMSPDNLENADDDWLIYYITGNCVLNEYCETNKEFEIKTDSDVFKLILGWIILGGLN